MIKTVLGLAFDRQAWKSGADDLVSTDLLSIPYPVPAF